MSQFGGEFTLKLEAAVSARLRPRIEPIALMKFRPTLPSFRVNDRYVQPSSSRL